MKQKVVIFGASGATGKYILRHLKNIEDIELSIFVRNPSKLENIDLANVSVIQGDALVQKDVYNAIENQKIVLASLEGDVLTMAENIVEASQKFGVKRIIWVTGMGIHHEIKGARGIMLNMLAKRRPEYVKAADTIASSKIDYTLLRCPMIADGENMEYYLTTEGIQPRKNSIDRAAIAKCMADMIFDDELGKNQSLGITN